MTKPHCVRFDAWFIILLIVGFLLFRSNTFFSYLYSNTAVSHLNKDGCDFSGSCLNPKQRAWLTTRLQRSLELSQNRRDGWRWLGIVFRENRQEEALLAWKKSDIMPGDILWWGRQEFAAQQFSEALSWFKTTVQLQPDYSDGWYELGRTYLKIEDWGAAASAFQQSVTVNNFSTVPKSSSYYHLGLSYQRYPSLRQPDAAFTAYTEALYWDEFRNYQEEADTYYGRAELHRENGRFEEAIHDYQQAIDINPEHEWTYLGLALAQYSLDGDLVQAEYTIKQAISLWPEGISKKWPYRSLGELYKQTGQNASAIEAFQQALTYDPSDKYVQELLDTLLLHAVP
ncbi:MAG: tetratricopeptide repeat protein [Ardenticatenaceae bacterium]|nr:tetratricopeptide repeat protein [Ardenticatenaceae bacterium]